VTAPRPAVVLIYQRMSLPCVFESAQRAGIDLILVPRPDESVSSGNPLPSVIEMLPLDVEADPALALDTLRKRHAAAPFDGIATPRTPCVSRQESNHCRSRWSNRWRSRGSGQLHRAVRRLRTHYRHPRP
jgi:hypothetical protein